MMLQTCVVGAFSISTLTFFRAMMAIFPFRALLIAFITKPPWFTFAFTATYIAVKCILTTNAFRFAILAICESITVLRTTVSLSAWGTFLSTSTGFWMTGDTWCTSAFISALSAICTLKSLMNSSTYILIKYYLLGICRYIVRP